MANRQRDLRLALRLTDDEMLLFREQYQKSGYGNRTDFLMALLRDKPIIVVEELKTVSAELRRQGTNLNQIARHLNSGGYLDTEIMEALTDCRRFYKKLKSIEVK